MNKETKMKNFEQTKSVFGSIEIPLTIEQRKKNSRKCFCRGVDARLFQVTCRDEKTDVYFFKYLLPVGSRTITNYDGIIYCNVDWRHPTCEPCYNKVKLNEYMS